MTQRPERLDLEAALATPPAPVVAPRPGVSIRNAGDEPGTFTWDGERGIIATRPLAERPRTWDAFLIDAGLDPDDVEVVEPVTIKGWDGLGTARTGEDGQPTNPVHRLRWYRLVVRRRQLGPSIDELVAVIGKRKPRKRPAPTGESTFVVALGDLQLGKIDADGPAGTIARAQESLEIAADRLRRLRKIEPVGPVLMSWMGDGCEGFVSQGGANIWRTVLTLTEQIRVLRRLMLYGVDLFRGVTDSLAVVGVPGNHDQALRPGGKGVTRYADSFDVEALVSVADALAMNPDAYGHVRVHVPEPDEATVTLETSGTVVTHAHGHMWRPGKAFDWWRGQAFGRHAAREADVLLCAHSHHLYVEDSGRRRVVQIPALEAESTWYRHTTGTGGNPGAVTMLARNGRVGYIDVTDREITTP